MLCFSPVIGFFQCCKNHLGSFSLPFKNRRVDERNSPNLLYRDDFPDISYSVRGPILLSRLHIALFCFLWDEIKKIQVNLGTTEGTNIYNPITLISLVGLLQWVHTAYTYVMCKFKVQIVIKKNKNVYTCTFLKY